MKTFSERDFCLGSRKRVEHLKFYHILGGKMNGGQIGRAFVGQMDYIIIIINIKSHSLESSFGNL